MRSGPCWAVQRPATGDEQAEGLSADRDQPGLGPSTQPMGKYCASRPGASYYRRTSPWSPAAARDVIQDSPHHRRVREKGNDAHIRAAGKARQRIHLIDAAQHVGPQAPESAPLPAVRLPVRDRAYIDAL